MRSIIVTPLALISAALLGGVVMAETADDMADGKVVKASAFFASVAFNELWQRVAPATSQ